MQLVGWFSGADCLGVLRDYSADQEIAASIFRPWVSKTPAYWRSTFAQVARFGEKAPNKIPTQIMPKDL